MNWTFEFTQDAEKDLRELPRPIQKRVARVMAQMAIDPFKGDVKPLAGPQWKGALRRRIGDYRIVFTANRMKRAGSVVCILIRSEKTYR